MNPPACSTQNLGFHVCVTDGFNVYDVFPGTQAPISVANPNVPVGLGQAYGLAFSSDVQRIGGGTGCLSSGTNPQPGLLAPAAFGVTGTNMVQVTDGPPFTSAILAADLCLLPSGIPQIPTGETLWVDPTSPTLVLLTTTTGATGTAGFPIPTGLLPVGLQLSFQWGLVDAAHPLGVCLTDACTFTIALR